MRKFFWGIVALLLIGAVGFFGIAPGYVEASMNKVDGKPLPNWLRYDATNKTFTANEVPAGAFPLLLKLAVGNTDSVVVIQEKPPGK